MCADRYGMVWMVHDITIRDKWITFRGESRRACCKCIMCLECPSSRHPIAGRTMGERWAKSFSSRSGKARIPAFVFLLVWLILSEYYLLSSKMNWRAVSTLCHVPHLSAIRIDYWRVQVASKNAIDPCLHTKTHSTHLHMAAMYSCQNQIVPGSKLMILVLCPRITRYKYINIETAQLLPMCLRMYSIKKVTVSVHRLLVWMKIG